MDCVFYSEFDNEAGPVLRYQAPRGFITPDQFDSISQYLITKQRFCGRLITLTAFGRRIMGFPVCIEDPKYGRNALIFNAGVVLTPRSEHTSDPEDFGPVVIKLASILHTLECESGTLSDTDKKSQLERILHTIHAEINLHGHCAVPVDDINTIHLQISVAADALPPADVRQVPVVVAEAADIPCSFDFPGGGRVSNRAHDLDLTLRKIWRHIDGVRSIESIAQPDAADVDVELVRGCVQHLVARGIVRLTDVFQFSNVYTPAPGMRHFATDPAMQLNCARFVSTAPDLATGDRLLRLYSGMSAGINVAEFCVRNRREIQALGIDVRRLVAFGTLNRFILLRTGSFWASAE